MHHRHDHKHKPRPRQRANTEDNPPGHPLLSHHNATPPTPIPSPTMRSSPITSTISNLTITLFKSTLILLLAALIWTFLYGSPTQQICEAQCYKQETICYFKTGTFMTRGRFSRCDSLWSCAVEAKFGFGIKAYAAKPAHAVCRVPGEGCRAGCAWA